jgi:ABC-type dipeptide/oligopeptide/nickel transport system permease component
MLRLLLGRLLAGIAVIICVATSSFFMLRLAPGGPFDEERRMPREVKANIEARYHLDRPMMVQYGEYMKELATFDLGHSMKRTQSVNEIIADHYSFSLRLGLLAIGFAVLFGIVLGVTAAYRQNSAWDHGAMTVALLGISIPAIVLGPILVWVFSMNLGWLPPARVDGFTSLILPALALGMIYTGVIARLSRGGMLETMRQDYIRTARAKGLSEHKVVWKHGLRLGLMPVVTYMGPALAHLIAGTFVVEQIFQIPGLGFYTIASITDRDYPVLTGMLVFYSMFLVFINLLVDIAYGFLDPRIREQR